jgi:hypothetical protein
MPWEAIMRKAAISNIPFGEADKIDRNINLLAGNLESLVGDIALMLYGTSGDPRLRAVQAELKAALKRLEAAKTPARALWNDALPSADQRGRGDA